MDGGFLQPLSGRNMVGQKPASATEAGAALQRLKTRTASQPNIGLHLAGEQWLHSRFTDRTGAFGVRV